MADDISAFSFYNKANKKNSGSRQNGVSTKRQTVAAGKENRFNPKNVDKLIEELYDNKEPLSAAQKRKKKQLDSFLSKQIDSGDKEDSDDSEMDNDDESSEDSFSEMSDAKSSEQSTDEDCDVGSDDSDEEESDCETDANNTSCLEYTLDSDAESDSNMDSSTNIESNNLSVSSIASSMSNTPSPMTQKPAQNRQKGAQKRAIDKLNDVNNNNPEIKKAKSRMTSPILSTLSVPKADTKRRNTIAGNAVEVPGSSKAAAVFCPFPRVQSGGKTSPLPIKSCPLPKTQPGAKSCPLLPKTKQQTEAKVIQIKTKAIAAVPNTKKNKHEQEIAAKERPEVHKQNSIEVGKDMLLWILSPVLPATFFKDYWEKNACHVQRKNPTYFSKLISFKMIDDILIRNHLEFTTNIDVTSYKKGVRETLNPEGRATPPTVWGLYGEGCSVRILNPSTYLSSLRQVCSVLQEFFHCLVGANVYLTPPNSQGFAPHFDDIEAFVLQVEGCKRWRLYMPPQPCDVLARVSSGNYKQEQLGPPIFDGVLEPGDILYFPRGIVHQAVTEKKHHSLHITLSVYQKQAFADLYEVLMPMVLERAIKHNLELRRGLPLYTWQNLGLANGGTQNDKRDNMVKHIQEMMQQCLVPSSKQIDAAVDQLAKRFQHEALPPTVLPEEVPRTVFGSRSAADEQGKCICDYNLDERTSVRLLRANILRLVADEGKLRVYYYVDNALEYCKYEQNYMEINPEEAASVEMLLHSYPAYVSIAQLPLKTVERRIEVATALWERGLLMTEKPFK